MELSKPFASTGPQGHRSRMRAKLLERGPDALADYELLEMLLFLGERRGDTKPAAKGLLNQFGSLAGFLSAPPEALEAAGVNAALRSVTAILGEAGRRMAADETRDLPHLGSLAQITAYLRASRQGPSLAVLHLNPRNRLLHDQRLPPATDPAQVARAMGEAAVRHHTSAVILAALRPGPPDCTPHDLDIANACHDASQVLAIALHDVLILGEAEQLSLREAELL